MTAATTTVQDIIDWTERKVGREIYRDEGLRHGSLETQVRRATVAWMLV